MDADAAMPLRGSLSISGNKLFAGGSDGRFHAFDKAAGRSCGLCHTADVLIRTQCAMNGTVYAGNDDGNLLAIEEISGKMLWRIALRDRFMAGSDRNETFISDREMDTFTRSGRWMAACSG